MKAKTYELFKNYYTGEWELKWRDANYEYHIQKYSTRREALKAKNILVNREGYIEAC